MIEYLLNDSQYAVFGGEDWPCLATDDEDSFISVVSDAGLEAIDGTQAINLDTKSSASMSTGWYVSSVVYTEEVSLLSYRAYLDGIPEAIPLNRWRGSSVNIFRRANRSG